MDNGPHCGYDDCGKALPPTNRSLNFCDLPSTSGSDEQSCQSKWARERLRSPQLWMFPYEEFTGYVPSDAFLAGNAAARQRLAVG